MAKVYEQVAEIIRHQITSGELEPLARIPSPSEMAEGLGVRDRTVGLAIASLEESNYLWTLPHMGTFVRPREYWEANEEA